MDGQYGILRYGETFFGGYAYLEFTQDRSLASTILRMTDGRLQPAGKALFSMTFTDSDYVHLYFNGELIRQYFVMSYIYSVVGADGSLGLSRNGVPDIVQSCSGQVYVTRKASANCDSLQIIYEAL